MSVAITMDEILPIQTETKINQLSSIPIFSEATFKRNIMLCLCLTEINCVKVYNTFIQKNRLTLFLFRCIVFSCFFSALMFSSSNLMPKTIPAYFRTSLDLQQIFLKCVCYLCFVIIGKHNLVNLLSYRNIEKSPGIYTHLSK